MPTDTPRRILMPECNELYPDLLRRCLAAGHLPNFAALLARMGIHPRVVRPVMAHQYQLRFNTAEERQQAAERLAA